MSRIKSMKFNFLSELIVFNQIVKEYKNER